MFSELRHPEVQVHRTSMSIHRVATFLKYKTAVKKNAHG